MNAEKVIEAGMLGIVDANRAAAGLPPLADDHAQWLSIAPQQEHIRNQARACLTAALAEARAQGAVLAVVPTLRECHPATAPGFDAEKNQRRIGYNAAIAAMRAAEVGL